MQLVFVIFVSGKVKECVFCLLGYSCVCMWEVFLYIPV